VVDVRGLVVVWLMVACAASAGVDEQSRRLYVSAEKTLAAGDIGNYRQQRAQLEDYPLAIYLDYRELELRLRRVETLEAQEFILASSDTPLQLRFKEKYLRRTGKDRRWQSYLAIAEQAPRKVELQCYYYLAQLAGGDESAAWEGAQSLWVHGESRPEVCDPLFAAWMKAGALDDDTAWQRMLLAFDGRRRNLVLYSARQGSASLQSWGEKLLAVDANPRLLLEVDKFPADQSRAVDILAHGMPRLARSDPARALTLWRSLELSHPFSTEQAERIGDSIAWRSVFDQLEANREWLDNYVARRGNDKLLETRLRWALREADWSYLVSGFESLSPARKKATVWRYWRAYALKAGGAESEARELWLELAGERDYYGFLAAEQVGQPYSLNHRPLVQANVDPALTQLGGVHRAGELMHHRKPWLAQSEWYYMVSRQAVADREHLSQYAGEQGWHRLAIDAATQAQAWDRLELRFPNAYADTFERFGRLRGVSATELLSIARRESAFLPSARSSAGARGLMQLMPATARSVASELGDKDLSRNLFDVENNVALGSAYYRQLLDQYQDNRIFTLAAYNAGPHRVSRWRNPAGSGLSVYQWVETIPFRETREYVQGVLAYNVVYRELRKQPVTLLTEAERTAVY
jgi:soluble lytic murein transglycosylase